MGILRVSLSSPVGNQHKMLNWRHSRGQFIIRHHPTSLNRRRTPFSINRRSDFQAQILPFLVIHSPMPAYKPANSTGTEFPRIPWRYRQWESYLRIVCQYANIMRSCEVYGREKNVLNFKRARIYYQ